MSTNPYGAQQRGDRDAYRRYLDGMDAAMRQKVALTAAHLLCEGRVADMGMGSGTGSEALAALYPALRVVGVDVSETMVQLARERYRLPNLEFIVGDIAQPVFPDASLDGIFDSSVLHHVTSFGGYDHAAAGRALATQARALREHGVLVVRDFLAPPAGDVLLDLPSDDGDGGDDPRTCSTARLFERFAAEFRPLSANPGFGYEKIGPHTEGARRFTRYRVDQRLAAEHLLRKDYRHDWESEVKEEYTYFTQADFEACYAQLGLRVLASTPLWNPWIVRNRWSGKVALHALDGTPLDLPPTNYVIAGERVPAGEGVRFRDAGPAAPVGFLALDCWRDTETGRVMDLVRRPHLTLDLLPWFEAGSDVFVLARKSYPRPILQAERGRSALLGDRRPPGYVTEPLSVLLEDRPVGLTVEDALLERARLGPADLRGFQPGATYYPSPGGILEEVRSVLVEIAPRFVEAALENRSGFSTSGLVRAIEARQLLRAAQVGGLPDARLELNVYALLAARGLDAGPWIGEAIAPTEVGLALTSLDALAQRPARRRFVRAPRDASTGFLALTSTRFDELGADGGVVATRALEHVAPVPFSLNTVAAAPLARVGGEWVLGIDDHDLPAAQCFLGNSQILVAPAWRLPHAVRSLSSALAFARERLAAEHGVDCGEAWELGGPYHPTPGLTAEVVHPFAFGVTSQAEHARPLKWVPLRALLERPALLVDGHLRICAFRCAHALGLVARATG